MTCRLFFDLNDCLLIDSRGLVVFDEVSQLSVSRTANALVNIGKCWVDVHQFAQCFNFFQPLFAISLFLQNRHFLCVLCL